MTNFPPHHKKLGFLGPVGSYSEMAALYLGQDMNLVECEPIVEVVREVSENLVEAAVLPIENSIQGSIAETVDGLYLNKLYINKALVIPINHCAAMLDINIDPDLVEIVYSHPQALGQCAQYILRTFPNAKHIPTPSTAQAIKKIAEEKLVKAVAIGNESAVLKYGLKIFAKAIQDEQNNETKFVLVSKEPNEGVLGEETSLVIVPKEDKPGLLFDILKFFKDNEINMNKIESRPSRRKLGTYIFHIDIVGDYLDSKVRKAIEGIEENFEVIFLGSYNILKYDKKS